MPLALVLNELLTNAAKHGINGRGTGEIFVKLNRANGEIVLAVEDDGPGFDLHETGRRSSELGSSGACRGSYAARSQWSAAPALVALCGFQKRVRSSSSRV